MKSKLFKVISLLLAAAMLLCLFSACGSKTEEPGTSDANAQTAAQSSAPASKGNDAAPAASGAEDEYVKVTVGLASSLGIFLSGLSPTECTCACDAVFNTVFKVDPLTKETYSEVLDDWYWEDDNHFVMKLKSGIYFSNGEEALPEDLLFSFTQHIDRGSSFATTMMLVGDGCVVRDDGSVVLEVSQKNSQVYEFIMYLYDKSWADSIGWDSEEWFTPVGSGPYYCADYVYDDHITLKLRDEYWAEDISNFYVDEYDILYYADSSTMFMALEAGDIDFCAVDDTDYSRYVQNGGDGYDCMKISTGVNSMFMFGFEENPIWTEYPELREAVAMGINWEELGVLVFGDLYEEVNSLAPKSGPFYYEAGKYEYNPEKAAEIVAGTGLSAEQLALTSTLMESPQYKSFGEGVKYYLEKIGFTVTLNFGDVASVIGAWTTPGSGMDFCMYHNIQGSAVGNPVVNIQATNVRPGLVFGYILDDTYQKYYEELAVSFAEDKSVQLGLFKQLQDYAFENALIIPYSEICAGYGYRTDRFTEEMMSSFVLTSQNVQLSDLGHKTTWGK